MNNALAIYLDLASRAEVATDDETVDFLHNRMDEAWYELTSDERRSLDVNTRPEWLACIRRDKSTSWCGCFIGEAFAFVDADHARREIARAGRLVPCPECLVVVK